MLIIAGLGQSRPEICGNRHIIGSCRDGHSAAPGLSPPGRRKFKAEISEGEIDGERVLLMKPQTS